MTVQESLCGGFGTRVDLTRLGLDAEWVGIVGSVGRKS